jgi:fluoride exporter
MNLVLFIFAAAMGGFIRFALERYLNPVDTSKFPRATFALNVIGAFLLGIVLGVPGEWRLILGVGFCGALTTFSGVSLQLHRRLIVSAYKQALIYSITLIACGVIAAGSGIILGRYLFT